MTIGEKIQMYRKKQKMSQEELGQKLLVSRQTISLWEKDQTVPTIDNLLRLKEIFNVSTDDILGVDDTKQNDACSPNESYQFCFTKNELNEIYRSQRKILYKRPIIFTVCCLLLIMSAIGMAASVGIIGFALGVWFIGTVSFIKGIYTYRKSWRKNTERVCNSTYEYKVFEDHMCIGIYRENEKIHEAKCYFKAIERVLQLDKWSLIQFDGQIYIIRKSDLAENSAFYSYIYKNPTKVVDMPKNNLWRVISTGLFVASLLSIFGALVLVGEVSVNNWFVENMWLFFLFTPVPIASMILGFVLKAKGYV